MLPFAILGFIIKPLQLKGAWILLNFIANVFICHECISWFTPVDKHFYCTGFASPKSKKVNTIDKVIAQEAQNGKVIAQEGGNGRGMCDGSWSLT